MSHDEDDGWEEYEKQYRDSFVKVGPIRIIAVRHNPLHGEFMRPKTTIIHSELFSLGFSVNTEAEHSIYKSNFFKEEWETHDRSVVESLLQSAKNGIYEIVGELYHAEWKSGYEEVEWNSDMDVRNVSMQKISYNHANVINSNFFADEAVYLTKVLDKEPCKYFIEYDTDIHHFMDKRQILQHHVNAICSIMDGERVKTSEMSEDELETFIHMCMLEIDSNSERSPKDSFVWILAQKMDEEVQKTIAMHEEVFGESGKKKVVKSN